MGAGFCASCGAALGSKARFCPSCGTATGSGADPAEGRLVPPSSPQGLRAPATPLSELRLNVLIAGLPLELWLVIALFAVPGAYLVQLSARALPDGFRAVADLSGPLQRLFVVLLVLIFLVMALGLALLGIAWMLQRRDRVGRGLAYVVVATLASLVIFGDGPTTGEILSMLAGLLAAAVLAFAPAVRDAFTGIDAPQRAQPTSIVVARVSLAIWIGLLALAAVLDFLIGDIDGTYVAVGVLELLIAAVVLALYLRLPIGDRTTRTIVTAGAAVAIVMLLIGRHDGGFVMLIGLTAAIPACLWLPADAREFYGDGPLLVGTRPNS